MTAKKILIEWLKSQMSQVIHYHDIERRVVDYGINYCGKMHNAGNYSRAFRQLKEDDQKELKAEGIWLEEDFQSNGVGRWNVYHYVKAESPEGVQIC